MMALQVKIRPKEQKTQKPEIALPESGVSLRSLWLFLAAPIRIGQ